MRSVRCVCSGVLLAVIFVGGCAREKVHRFEASRSAASTRPAAVASREVDPGYRTFNRFQLATTRPAATAGPARVTLRRPAEYSDRELKALASPSSNRPLLRPLSRSLDSSALDAPRLVIDFLDVGQGDCTLVTFPNGKRLLIDCGSVKNGPVSKIRPALLSRLDAANPVVHELVITHPDRDHYNRLEEVLEGVTVGRVTTVGHSDEFPQADTDKWLENRFSGSRYRVVTADESTPLPAKVIADFGEATAEIVAANVDPEGSNSPNSRSVVLKISFGAFDCLLTGDATFETEEAIANRYADAPEQIDVEVLKLGHHGSRVTSTSPDWPALVRPEATIVSCANANTFGHPSDRVVDSVYPFTEDRDAHGLTVRSGGSDRTGTARHTPEAVYSTENSGNIRVISDGSQTFYIVENVK